MIRCAVVAVMLSCSIAADAQRVRAWVIEALPPLPGASFGEAYAVNDRGEAVGWSGATPPTAHAVLWRDGMAIDLGTLGGAQSRAWDINDRGQIVGESEVASGDFHAFLWEDGMMHDLAEAGPFNRALSINNHGDVAGHWQFQALLWRNGVLTELTGMITARDVNDHDEVAGALVVGGTILHPAIWRDGAVVDLTPDASDGPGIAWAINRRGVVVGEMNGAFRWEDGVMTELGPGAALDVDRAGRLIVGESAAVSADGFPRATLWDETRRINLGTLPGGGNSTAWGISERGTFIAGFASDATGRVTATRWTWR